MRKVTLFSTQSNLPTEILSSAGTWGALKAEISDHIKGDMKLSVRETRTVLTSDNLDYILPEGEFVIFMTANKMKSGK